MIVGKWHCATAVLFHCWHSVVGWLEVKWRFALHYRLLFICWNNCRVVYVCALVWPLVWQQCIVLCAVSHVQEYAVDESQKYKVWNYVMMRQHSDTGVIIEFLMTTQNHLFLMICHQFVLLWLLKHRKECCGVSVYIYIYMYIIRLHAHNVHYMCDFLFNTSSPHREYYLALWWQLKRAPLCVCRLSLCQWHTVQAWHVMQSLECGWAQILLLKGHWWCFVI